MYRELAKDLFIAPHHTVCLPWGDLSGDSAVDLSVITSAAVTVVIQCSSDSETWADTRSAEVVSGPGCRMWARVAATQRAAKHLRVKLTAAASGAVVTVGIDSVSPQG